MKKLVATLLKLALPLLLLIQTACAAHAGDNPKAPTPPPTPPKTSAGIDPATRAALADLDAYVQNGMKDFGIPGAALAVVADGQVLLAKGYGVKRMGSDAPVTSRTVFQVGSTSKAFTATLMAMLAEQKKISWDATVRSILPGFAMPEPYVTEAFQVKDLMAQRSGLPGHAGDGMYILGWSKESLYAAMPHFTPATSFRSTFGYQNCLFLVAGDVIEKTGGLPWAAAIKERIFDPLRMHDASADLGGILKAPDHAAGHFNEPKGAVPIPDDWAFNDWPYRYGPAGGINASVTDMANWVMVNAQNGKLGDKTLFSPESARFLRSASIHTPADSYFPGLDLDSYYTQGWVRTETPAGPAVWHTGATTGMSCVVGFLPSKNIGMVWLTNLGDNSFTIPVFFHFLHKVLGVDAPDLAAPLLAKHREAMKAEAESAKAPKARSPALPAEAYVGTYVNDVLGPVVVERGGKGLQLRMGPRPAVFDMLHVERDTFDLKGEFPDGDEAVFEIGPDGKARALNLELFSNVGVGRLMRAE